MTELPKSVTEVLSSKAVVGTVAAVASCAGLAYALRSKDLRIAMLCRRSTHCRSSEGRNGHVLEETLAAKAERVRAHMKQHPPTLVDGVDPSLHYLAPHMPKVEWNALGDLVTDREKTSSGSISGERWVSLRLDGSGFSRTVRMMRNKGILEKDGFSPLFASCMCSSMEALMEHF